MIALQGLLVQCEIANILLDGVSSKQKTNNPASGCVVVELERNTGIQVIVQSFIDCYNN